MVKPERADDAWRAAARRIDPFTSRAGRREVRADGLAEIQCAAKHPVAESVFAERGQEKRALLAGEWWSKDEVQWQLRGRGISLADAEPTPASTFHLPGA